MNFKILLYLGISLLLFEVQDINAQNVPAEGTVGIRASMQGGQADLLFPYRISNAMSIAPLIGFQSVEDGLTSLRVGIKPQFFRNMGSDFATYIGALGIMRMDAPNVGDNSASYTLGVNGGGEYFLSSRFSLGVEGLLNLTVDNQNSVRTGAAVSATYYF